MVLLSLTHHLSIMTKKQIKNILRVLFIAASIGSLWFVPWILVRAWIIPLPDTIEEQVQEGLNYGFEGVIAYVDQKGRQPEFYSAGWKDRDQKIPANPHDLFKIASISKLYVAVAISKLVAAREMTLDDKLSDYFPDLKNKLEYADEITIEYMVQHRSGIPNFTNKPRFWENEQANGENALEFALELPTSFEPDADYEYSNTNYLLLRQIIDKVTGQPHEEYIKTSILAPLHLDNTHFSIKDVRLENVMSGYYIGYPDDLKENENGMLATAQDVGTFLRALNDGSVFNEGEQEIYDQIYVYNHGGLVPGYQSLAEYHADIDAVVVQFINTTDFEGYEWNLSEILINRVVKILEKR
jgi:CubicO group peptidase (beta-lactamase class C family)